MEGGRGGRNRKRNGTVEEVREEWKGEGEGGMGKGTVHTGSEGGRERRKGREEGEKKRDRSFWKIEWKKKTAQGGGEVRNKR